MPDQDKLTPLQRDLLKAFFSRQTGFFLTGGGALAGFHLGHRPTHDLDFFTTTDILDEGDRALEDAADALGATLEKVQTSPGFRRRLVKRGQDAVIVLLASNCFA